MNEYEVAQSSIERFKRTSNESKEAMGEQIIDTANAQILQSVNIWLDAFSSQPNSNVYNHLSIKGLY